MVRCPPSSSWMIRSVATQIDVSERVLPCPATPSLQRLSPSTSSRRHPFSPLCTLGFILVQPNHRGGYSVRPTIVTRSGLEQRESSCNGVRLLYPCGVPCVRLRAAGWEPPHQGGLFRRGGEGRVGLVSLAVLRDCEGMKQPSCNGRRRSKRHLPIW